MALLQTSAFTDYPGGLKREISFPLHRKIGFGLSSLTAAMPEFLAFEQEREEHSFARNRSSLRG